MKFIVGSGEPLSFLYFDILFSYLPVIITKCEIYNEETLKVETWELILLSQFEVLILVIAQIIKYFLFSVLLFKGQEQMKTI